MKRFLVENFDSEIKAKPNVVFAFIYSGVSRPNVISREVWAKKLKLLIFKVYFEFVLLG